MVKGRRGIQHLLLRVPLLWMAEWCSVTDELLHIQCFLLLLATAVALLMLEKLQFLRNICFFFIG
jgi:hypothetical protein